MKLGSYLKSLNRQYVASIGLGCKYQAGQYGLAVQIYGAGATFPGAAALLGAGQAQSVPEDVNQPVIRTNSQHMGFAIDLNRDVDFFHCPHLRILFSRDLRTNTATIFLR